MSSQQKLNAKLIEAIDRRDIHAALLLVNGSLLRGSANVHHATPDEETFLMAASAKAMSDLVKRLIEKNVDVHAVDARGNTALHHVFTGEVNHARNWVCAMAIVRAGADINAVNQRGATPLLLSIRHMVKEWLSGYSDMVEFMVAHGAGLLERDAQGDSCAQLMVDNPNLFNEQLVCLAGSELARASLDQETASSPLIAKVSPRL